MDAFKTTQTLENGTATVHLCGRLDFNTSPGFEKELQSVFDGKNNLVLDCAALDYVSSAGLRVFLTAYKKCAANQCEFRITKVNAVVREVMDMVGFSDIMTID